MTDIIANTQGFDPRPAHLAAAIYDQQRTPKEG